MPESGGYSDGRNDDAGQDGVSTKQPGFQAWTISVFSPASSVLVASSVAGPSAGAFSKLFWAY